MINLTVNCTAILSKIGMPMPRNRSYVTTIQIKIRSDS